jgi:hypothetical protein
MSDTDADAPEPIDAENIKQINQAAFLVFDPESVNTYRVNLSPSNPKAGDYSARVHNAETGQEVTDTTDKMRLIRSAVFHGETTLSPEMEQLGVLQKTADMLLHHTNNVSTGGSQATGGGGGGGDGGDDDGGELDTSITQDHSFDLDSLEDDVMEWLDNYGSVKADFDPSIVEINHAQIEGEIGLQIETNPFKSGYWSDGDWQDKDAYDDAQEAFRDIMQDADPIEYYGEPDYINFLPAADVGEVVG